MVGYAEWMYTWIVRKEGRIKKNKKEEGKNKGRVNEWDGMDRREGMERKGEKGREKERGGEDGTDGWVIAAPS